MTFINSEIDLASLPAVESVRLQPIAKKYRRLLQVEWLITAVFLAIIVALVIIFQPSLQMANRWVWIIAIYVVLMTVYYVLQEKAFSYKAFAVREYDVIYQKGWLVRKTKICPYNRVQNCSLQSGPLERKYQLASLLLYTAGSEGADMKIPGLEKQEAEQLRHYILSKINGTHTSAL
ncbi:MAG TPA: PH domain-containing protein [Flavisolibacter sp.]|nr:PH domain-containing protein [Flavisolibacter sp.]